MWIFEHFYWILIIGFAILSALSKSGKRKTNQNPQGMPTFGGGAGMEQRTAPANRQASSRRREEEADARASSSEPRYSTGSDAWSEETSSSAQRSYELQTAGPDYETGEGVSGMWQEERPDPLADYSRDMEKHLEQVNASLNRIEKTAVSAPAKQTRGERPASRLASEARKGIIWAEILGPPRSKRPYGGRK